MAEYRLNFHLSSEEYLRYYQGSASAIVTTAEDGTRVRFPANALRPYVTAEGVSGRFILVTDENNKLIEFKKL